MLRYLTKCIESDLEKKMVFLGGPRQVGKTTLAKTILKHDYPEGEYFNWDYDEDRKIITKKLWGTESPLIVFDELHKYPRWKTWIKGLYDKNHPSQNYLVTGSARLDTYKRGGDSLLGRYHYWRLHPFTLDEHPDHLSKPEVYSRLLSMGGFPEPFLLNDAREAKRWRRERFDRILKEDLRDLEMVREIQLLFLFMDALRTRSSSLIVLSNIAEDLQISPKTAKKWLLLIEKMYLGFSIYPYTKNIARSIIKPPKFYFYDNADTVDDSGVRLENLVATHLLKRLHFREDYFGERCKLHYIRDKSGREVDFITEIDGKIFEMIEVKTSNTDISTSLKYYKSKLNPERCIQLVGNLKQSFEKDGVHVTNPINYFKQAPWKDIPQEK